MTPGWESFTIGVLVALGYLFGRYYPPAKQTPPPRIESGLPPGVSITPEAAQDAFERGRRELAARAPQAPVEVRGADGMVLRNGDPVYYRGGRYTVYSPVITPTGDRQVVLVAPGSDVGFNADASEVCKALPG